MRGPCGVTRLWQFQVYIDDSLRAGQSWVAKSVAGGQKIPSTCFCSPGLIHPHPLPRTTTPPPTTLLPIYSHPDLLEPHILRSLSNVKAVSVHASCAGCHAIVLDIEGTAWLFGRNQPAALGVPGVDTISENAPRRLRATDLGAPSGTVFVNAACGRSHSVLVGSNGRVWTTGLNSLGQVRKTDPS